MMKSAVFLKALLGAGFVLLASAAPDARAAEAELPALSLRFVVPDDWQKVDVPAEMQGFRLMLPKRENDPWQGKPTFLVESLETLRPKYRTLEVYAERARTRLTLMLPNPEVAEPEVIDFAGTKAMRHVLTFEQEGQPFQMTQIVWVSGDQGMVVNYLDDQKDAKAYQEAFRKVISSAKVVEK